MELVRNLPQQYRQDPWVLGSGRRHPGRPGGSEPTVPGAPGAAVPGNHHLGVGDRGAGGGDRAACRRTLESRRSVLAARYRSSGKVSIETIQAVADAWRNGEVDVDFAGGRIQVTFVGDYGVPEDLQALQEAIGRTIPAHLPIDYFFRYLLIREIHQVKTLTQMQQLTLKQFAGGRE